MFRRFKDLQINTDFYWKGHKFSKVGAQHMLDKDGVIKHILPNETVVPHPDKVVRPSGPVVRRTMHTRVILGGDAA